MPTGTETARAREDRVLEIYLGFEVRRCGADDFVALPHGWSRPAALVLEARDLPALRRVIWNWWHRLLD